jgi:hypothetical protein
MVGRLLWTSYAPLHEEALYDNMIGKATRLFKRFQCIVKFGYETRFTLDNFPAVPCYFFTGNLGVQGLHVSFMRFRASDLF